MNRKSMPRKFAHAALMAIALALSLLGNGGNVWSDRDQLRDEVRRFHMFLQGHPKVSTDLRNNPQLVNNKKYSSKHDDLEKFLKRYPAVRHEISEHPRRIFGRYYRDEDHDRRRYQ
jgi:hypothetical protein